MSLITITICVILIIAMILLAPITSRITIWILDHTLGRGWLGYLFASTIGRWWDFLDRKLDGQ